MTDALKINKVAQTIDAINGFTLAVGGKEVYHPDNKPSAADLNVVNKAGDTMAGNLTAPKVLVSAAQGTEANSLTRKDYVDGKFAAVTAPSAILPMVIDANKAISIKPAASNTAGSMSAADKNKLDAIQGFAVDGKSDKLKGPINFDSIESSGFYNLYNAKATGSVNPPPFDYGTMIVIGSDKDGNTFVTQSATDQRTNKVYTRTRNDGSMAWTDWKETLNEDSDVGYGYHHKFDVGGDANTFYPVSINLTGGDSGYSWKRYSFSRHYAAKAPDTWNNKTHKGGLTLEFQMTNDSGWGGNSHSITVNEFNQTYTTVCGGLALTTGSMIVWLRGGGAEYMFHSDEANKTGIVVNLDRYIAADKKEFLTRNTEQAIAGYIAEILPRWSIRNGEVYDKNRRVMVPDSDVGLTIRNGAPMIQFVETDKNDKTYIMVADGGGIRLQEDSTGVGGKIIYQYNPSWEGISLLKPFTDAMGTGTKSLVTKEYADAIDAKNVAKTGDTMTGNLTFANDGNQIIWSRNSDFAKIGFKNDSDSDTDSHMWFETGDNGNEYFKFRYRMSGATTAVDLLDIKKEKADFHIPISAHEVKNSITLNNKSSISFADAANTRFHLWADGNAFKLNHGTEAQTAILSVLPDGTCNSIGTFTAKDFIQTTAQTNNAAASTRKDYVDNLVGTLRNDVYSKGGSDARYTIKSGDTMTGNLTVPKVLLSAAQGTEANALTRKDYVDAQVKGVEDRNVNKSGDTISGLLTVTNLSSVNNAPYVELHKPGHVAYSWNIAADNRLMLSQTSGNGVVAGDILAINQTDGVIRINAQRWTNARNHTFAGQFSQNAPITVDFGAGAGVSDYYPVIKSRHVTTKAGYTTDVELGILRSAPDGNGWGQGIIRVGSGEGATPQAIYTFDISGNFSAANVRITSDVRLKSDIKPIENALYKVEQLSGKTYIKQGKQDREAGIIAQDLQKVLPESVGEYDHADGNKYLSVEHAGINALLIEAIKELSVKVKQLEARGK